MEEEDVGQVRELLEELALRPLDDDVALEDDHPVSPASCGVYVLELAGGKLYVGSSADWDSRIEQHKAASGATAWTAVHRFLSVKSKLPLAPVLPRTELDKVLRRKELGAPGECLVYVFCGGGKRLTLCRVRRVRCVCGHGVQARAEQCARLLLHDG